MAQYNDIIGALETGSYGTAVSTPLAGLTRRLNTSAITTYSVNSDVDSPSGKSLKISHTGSNNRTVLSIDAIDTDPDRNVIELIALVRQNATASGSVGGYAGIQTGMSGTSTTNNRGVTVFAGRDNGTAINRASYYTGSTVAPNVTMTGSAPHYTVGQLQWLRIRMNNLDWLLDTYDANDLRGTPRSSYADVRPNADGDNRAGLFSFLANCNLDVLWLSAGTGSDAAPAPGDEPAGNNAAVSYDIGSIDYSVSATSSMPSGNSASISYELPGISFSASADAIPPSGTALTLLTRFDGSSASSVNSTITDPTSYSPVVYVTPRARTMSVFGFWRNVVFGLGNAAGKRPVIRIDRSTMDTPATAPLAEHSAAFTYDWVNFFHASSWTSTGPTGYFEYQFDEDFTQDAVYICFNPMYPNSQSSTYAAAALANNPGVVSPMPAAVAYKAANPSAPTGALFVTNANTLYPATNPDEEMTGFPLGSLPVYGLKADWGSTLGGTTDGGPKRVLWVAYGQHAQGEGQSSISFYAALDWMLYDSSPAAIAFRRNWIVYATFNINGSGIAGGHVRLSYGYGASNTNNAQDFNRVWTATGTPNVPEVAAVRSAIRADTGGRIDALIDWHGNGTGRGQFNIIASSTVNVANQERFNEIAATVFDMTNAVIQYNAPNGYIIDEANTTLGATLAYHAEHDQRGLNTKSDLELTGVRHMLTLQLADADGMFYQSESGSAVISYDVGEIEFSVGAVAIAPPAQAAVTYDIGEIQYSVSAVAFQPGNSAQVGYDIGAIDFSVTASSTAPVIAVSAAYDIGQIEFAASAAVSTPVFAAVVGYDIGAVIYAVTAEAAGPAPQDIQATIAYDIGAISFSIYAATSAGQSLRGVGYGVQFTEMPRGVTFN